MTDQKILGKMQLGKQGITKNFLETLESFFKTHQNVKVSVLKSAGREEIKSYATKLEESLGKNYTTKIVGFIINIKKWKREMRK